MYKLTAGLIVLVLCAASASAGDGRAQLVKDIIPGPEGDWPDAIWEDDGTLEFRFGNDLWRSDGTRSGTEQFGSVPGWYPTRAGDLFFYRGQSSAGASELWRSDGTEAGTFVVKDPGAAESYINYMRPVGQRLFFSVVESDDVDDEAWWVTDGTREGTHSVIEMAHVAGTAFLTPLASSDALYFVGDATAVDVPEGTGLWRTDGTAEGTELIHEVDYGGSRPTPYPRYAFRNGLFYTLKTSDREQLWLFDERSGTSSKVATFEIGPDDHAFDPFVQVGDKFYFEAFTPRHCYELWVTDGTPRGTHLVRDIAPGLGWSFSQPVAAWRGDLYFAADDQKHGHELWRTDGTSRGTRLVKDVLPGRKGSDPMGGVVYKGRLFMSARDGNSGHELWSTDGTARGTVLEADIRPGPRSSFAEPLMVLDGTLFLWANDGTHGQELMKFDG